MSVPTNPPARTITGQSTPECSCGAHCPTHGSITIEDRLAAWKAGFDKGIIEGRLNALESELDIKALRQAADLLEYVRIRTHALTTGPNWAAEVADAEPDDGTPDDDAEGDA